MSSPDDQMFPECPRCLEEIAAGVGFKTMPDVRVVRRGYVCAKHGLILKKDMRPNDETVAKFNVHVS